MAVAIGRQILILVQAHMEEAEIMAMVQLVMPVMEVRLNFAFVFLAFCCC